jgi:hypothetical protein
LRLGVARTTVPGTLALRLEVSSTEVGVLDYGMRSAYTIGTYGANVGSFGIVKGKKNRLP